jgi:peptide/nickel transport system permease protein
MPIYSARRIGLALVSVPVPMTMLFSMIYLMPGDPASIALGPRAPPAMKAQVRPPRQTVRCHFPPR